MIEMFRKAAYLKDFNSGTLTLRKVEYKGKLECAKELKKLEIAADKYRKRSVDSEELDSNAWVASDEVKYYPPGKITFETIDTYVLPLKTSQINYFRVVNPTPVEKYLKISNGVTKELSKFQSEFIKQFSTIIPNEMGSCERVYAIFKNGKDTGFRVINPGSLADSRLCLFNIDTLKAYSANLRVLDNISMLSERVSLILAKTNPGL